LTKCARFGLEKIIYLRTRFKTGLPASEKLRADTYTVVVAQSVRAPDCGSGGRGFETHLPPREKPFGDEGLFLWGLVLKLSFYFIPEMLLPANVSPTTSAFNL